MTITTHPKIDVHAAMQLTEAGATLIDVRGFDEFATGHAVGARCIPLPDLERRCGEIASDNPILVICKSGGRSAMAAERLLALGLDNVVDVDGGFDAWSKAGLPIDRQTGVIPLERQVRGIAGSLVLAFTIAGAIGPKWYLAVPAFVGFMLTLSCITGLCPMMKILSVMPWNRINGKERQ